MLASPTVEMNGTAPTLLFLPGDYKNERNTPIENIFPLVFPYDTGGFRMKHGRRNRMSMEAIMEHYLGLSLAQFHRHIIMEALQDRKKFVRNTKFCEYIP